MNREHQDHVIQEVWRNEDPYLLEDFRCGKVWV